MNQALSPPHHEVAGLYREHHGWLHGWLWRKLGNAFEAADLAQDTFMRLLCSPAHPDAGPLHEPRAYLATVARRLLLNHLRRQSLEAAYLQALQALPQAHQPSPEQRVLTLEALQEVDAMLDGLPPKVRTVFVLAQVEGLSYADIAAELGIGLRSVKRYMAQAMAECILLGA
jgi:RNA polymerase sigma-70 factor (ECF subfamily)